MTDIPDAAVERALDAWGADWRSYCGIAVKQLKMDMRDAFSASGLYAAGCAAQREADAKAVRENCTMCAGTGNAEYAPPGAPHECEYCGRPMAAIRASADAKGGGE